MASITSSERNALPASKFALPDERKYPIDTAGRARNALARASQQFRAGRLNEAQHAEIVRKAEKKLGKSMAEDRAEVRSKR